MVVTTSNGPYVTLSIVKLKPTAMKPGLILRTHHIRSKKVPPASHPCLKTERN